MNVDFDEDVWCWSASGVEIIIGSIDVTSDIGSLSIQQHVSVFLFQFATLADY
jgi:hypothetical protein